MSADAPNQAAAPAWYYARQKAKVGPLTWERLWQLANEGQVQPSDMVLQEGNPRWTPAAQVPGLFSNASRGSGTDPVVPEAEKTHYPVACIADPEASRYEQASADTQHTNYVASSSPRPAGQTGSWPNSGPRGSDLPRRFGHYELLAEIARGGMGVVYKARQIGPNGQTLRPVALKMILAGGEASPEVIQRFWIEAQTASALNHPNVVRIFEVGEIEGRPFFSMELVEAGSLSDLVRNGPLRPAEAAWLVEQIAGGVQAVHEQGVIHRDIKPQNILVPDSQGQSPIPSSPYRTPKLTDFGLARTREGGGSVTGDQLGTPSYMAPEQAAGKVREVSAATDVYGLGAVLYCLLTGRPPFQSSSRLETMRLVLTEEPVPPRQLNPAVPRDLETICLKSLRKDSDKRYASAIGLVGDLRRFLNGEPILARPVGWSSRAWKWARRNPGKASAAAAVLFLVLGVFFWQRAEQMRVQAEQNHRRDTEERLLQQVSGYEGAAQAQLAAGIPGFALARDTLNLAIERLEGQPELAARHSMLAAKRDRVHRVAAFYARADLAWFQAGNDDGRNNAGLAACQAALESLGVLDEQGRFTGSEWWLRFPDADLTVPQRVQLQDEVYRQVVLLGLLRLKHGFMPLQERLERQGMFALLGLKDPSAAAWFRVTLEMLEQAQALERVRGTQSSKAIQLTKKTCRILLSLSSGEPVKAESSAVETLPPVADASMSFTQIEAFFDGILHFYIHKFGQGAIASLTVKYLGSDLDPNPLPRAEEKLRIAASLEPRHFWPHFMLGWTLLTKGDYSGAELAFNTCVVLRENDPRSYQFRAMALVRQALKLTGEGAGTLRLRGELIRRAEADRRQALQIDPTIPDIYWLGGELFAALGKIDSALDSYARAMEVEDNQLLQRTVRRYFLDDARTYLEKTAKANPGNADVHAVLALLYFRLKKPADAEQAVRRSLQLRPGHPRALSVRGALFLQKGNLDAALADFEAVLKLVPGSYLAASGRALVLEKRGEHSQGLMAYSDLLSKSRPDSAPAAFMDWQRCEAYLGRYRILQRLGQHAEAEKALREARNIDAGTVADALARK